MGKVAVILSGCGHQDGSEIHEAVLCFLELSYQGHDYQCFAPNKSQTCVMNHLTNQKSAESRNCLVEAARIARGNIFDLHQLQEKHFDALLFPGGGGAALNLCDYGIKGTSCSVDAEVQQQILSFYEAKKPIGATCIAPVMLAKALQGASELSLTLGSDPKQKQILQQMGVKHPSLKPVEDCLVDPKNKIFTTPCYMEQATISQIHQGIKKLIQSMFEAP